MTRNRQFGRERRGLGPVRLSDVPVGFVARLHDTELDPESRSQLRALGLTDGSVLRVCKQGEPCVVRVRTTRIGISGQVARRLFVLPADGWPRGVAWP